MKDVKEKSQRREASRGVKSILSNKKIKTSRTALTEPSFEVAQVILAWFQSRKLEFYQQNSTTLCVQRKKDILYLSALCLIDPAYFKCNSREPISASRD